MVAVAYVDAGWAALRILSGLFLLAHLGPLYLFLMSASVVSQAPVAASAIPVSVALRNFQTFTTLRVSSAPLWVAVVEFASFALTTAAYYGSDRRHSTYATVCARIPPASSFYSKISLSSP